MDDYDVLEEKEAMEMAEDKRKSELAAKLNEIAKWSKNDPEKAHGDADDLLIEFINSSDVKAAYENIDKWFA